MKQREKILQRFNDKWIEHKNGCWIWVAANTYNGYGRFWFEGVHERTNRVSWRLHRGEIPEGMHVLHVCDEPACCNPDHLYLGTHADNMGDKARKGRGGKPPLKLSAPDVLAIRADTRSHKAIANDYGVTEPHITNIKNRKSWAQIPAQQLRG